MNGGHLTALSSGNYVSELTSCNIQRGHIILMVWPALEVLLSLLILLDSSKESLFATCQVLHNSKSSSWEDDLAIVLSKVEDCLVSVSREPVHMIDLVGTVRLAWIAGDAGWCLLSDLLQEGLSILFLSFLHIRYAKILLNKIIKQAKIITQKNRINLNLFKSNQIRKKILKVLSVKQIKYLIIFT